MTGKSEMEEPRKQCLSIQRGVRVGSWEEEARQGQENSSGCRCVGSSHPQGSVTMKSRLRGLWEDKSMAAENVSVGRESGIRTALDASAQAGLLGRQRR